MQTNQDLTIPRQSFSAVPLNNNEILVHGADTNGNNFSEIVSVKKNTAAFTTMSVLALDDYQIDQAVCISNNKVVAYAIDQGGWQLISFTKDAIPSI